MTESDLVHKDQYYVAAKLFLEKNDQLFIFKDKWNDWDLPGGRIRKHEFETPIEEIVKRKMKEEVGEQVVYRFGVPLVTMRHERIDASPGGGVASMPVRIFAVGYEAILESGEPQLGDHHVEMKWVDIATFKPEEYFTGGWLRGVQDYLILKRK